MLAETLFFNLLVEEMFFQAELDAPASVKAIITKTPNIQVSYLSHLYDQLIVLMLHTYTGRHLT